ncbi:MAG: choice-of-anchor Q domain-containing protein, partial [bacterium]|nr:choice-of-anchor Q domain-containing protein [bacterium]
ISNTEIVNSIFWGLSEQFFSISCGQTVLFAYNDVQDGKFPQAGVGNIQINPMFVRSGVWSNNTYIPGDYHIALESPIINAGDPNTVLAADETDIDGNPRQRLGRIDIGAYESGTHPMDFDENGRVDFRDFARFAQDWLWKGQW